MNILYNKNLLSKYDSNFYPEYLFMNELSENSNYKLLKHTRKVISIHNLSKYIYISTLNINKSEFGYLVSTASNIINLSKVGENVFYLSYIEFVDKLALYSILHTFMAMKNCYIDISKFSYLFDDFENIYLHVLQK